MFPHRLDSAGSPTRSLRSAFRNAADLVIAFITLESYGIDHLRLSAAPSAHGDPPTDYAAARPDPSPIDRAAGASEHPIGQPETPTRHPRGSQHPHRHELRAPKRSGRPCAGAPRAQLCLTPLRRSRAPSPTNSPPPYRPTASRESPH